MLKKIKLLSEDGEVDDGEVDVDQAEEAICANHRMILHKYTAWAWDRGTTLERLALDRVKLVVMVLRVL